MTRSSLTIPPWLILPIYTGVHLQTGCIAKPTDDINLRGVQAPFRISVASYTVPFLRHTLCFSHGPWLGFLVERSPCHQSPWDECSAAWPLCPSHTYCPENSLHVCKIYFTCTLRLYGTAETHEHNRHAFSWDAWDENHGLLCCIHKAALRQWILWVLWKVVLCLM